MSFLSELSWFVKTLFNAQPQDSYKPTFKEMKHFPFKGYLLMWCGYIIYRADGKKDFLDNPTYMQRVVNHESIHMAQAYDVSRTSYIPYYLSYLMEWLRANPILHPNAAYYLNPYECEAYANEYDNNYLKKRESEDINLYVIEDAWTHYKNAGCSPTTWYYYLQSIVK